MKKPDISTVIVFWFFVSVGISLANGLLWKSNGLYRFMIFSFGALMFLYPMELGEKESEKFFRLVTRIGGVVVMVMAFLIKVPY